MVRNQADAPHFTLPCQDGTPHSFKEYLGKPLVILFMRGRFCPSMKRTLNIWQDFAKNTHSLGAELIGISSDTIENHAWLYKQYDITFPLLSDADMSVSNAYGLYSDVYQGKPYGEPAIYIIDKDGKVAFSAITSGPKGMPDPGNMAPILIYMSTHGGKY